MLPDNFDEVLSGKCYLINLDRCIERWPVMEERISAAGFIPERIAAVDGLHGNRRKKWLDIGARSDYKDVFDSDGQSGCGLSHVGIWDHIVKNDIPFASIFEDDAMFHKDWKELAPMFYQHTDKNTDIVYYGSQGANASNKAPLVTEYPVFCTHAYMITRDGAAKLLNAIRTSSQLFSLDCFIIELMKIGKKCPFRWQCWNGVKYDDPARKTALEYRNDGIVFQDASYESNIHCQALPDAEK